MNLNEAFGDLISEKSLLERVIRQKKTQLRGLCGSSIAFILSDCFKKGNITLMIALSDRERAAYLYNELQSILNTNQVHFFPD